MESIRLTKEDLESFKGFMSNPDVKCIKTEKSQNFVELYFNTDQKFVVEKELYDILYPSKYANNLIFGKDKTENVVCVEVKDDIFHIYKESDAGVELETRPAVHWLVTKDRVSSKQVKLEGDQNFKWLATFDSLADYITAKKKLWNYDHYKISDVKESALVYHGMTYFKGMTVSDVSILSFDIETDGLRKHNNSEIYLITNTFRKKGYVEKKTFNLANYSNQGDMLLDWVKWVKEKDPSVLAGHNIMSYDIPYIVHVAELNNVKLEIGRDNSEPKIASYTSKFRKDGSQSYDYQNIWIFGREIVDTFFLSIKYDVARNFESYGLKAIVKHLGLEKQGRSFVDASKIKEYFYNRDKDPTQWNSVVQYAEEDSEDALKLYDLMAPSYFYFTQSVSKSWQQMINSATGSQINNMMVRAYFQEGHSIAKADEVEKFSGGISIGIPGFYKNALKWDLQSAYPHTIIQFELYDKAKDPKAYFLNMVKYFTSERIKNKKLAKETKDKYFKDLEQSQKISINSMFGFCGATGLSYNSPKIAAEITKKCRGYIRDSIMWATGQTLEHWEKLSDGEIQDEE